MAHACLTLLAAGSAKGSVLVELNADDLEERFPYTEGLWAETVTR